MRGIRGVWDRWSIRGRMMAGLSVIVFAVVLIVFLYLPRRLEHQATEALLDKGRSMAEMAAYTLSAAVYFDDRYAIEEVLGGVRADGDVVFVSALDRDGDVLGWSGSSRAAIDSVGRHLLEVAAPITYQERGIGRVEVGLSMASLRAAIAASRLDAAVVCLVLLLGGLLGVYALTTLLTRLERRNSQLEARFRTIFESSSIGMALIDANGHIFDTNPALRRMSGTPDLTRRGIEELLDPSERRQVIDWLSDLLRGRTSLIRTEVRAAPLFGPASWLHLSLSAVRQPRGTLEFINVLFEDVTEQRQLMEQLQQSQKMEAIGRLAGGIAHDFNNLLTTINGTADLALSASPPAELTQDLLDILQAGKRAAELTTQLLAFSRRQIREARLIDLDSVVGETAMLLRRMIGENIRLHVALGKGTPTVVADSGQVGQILMNLAVNARDAIGDDGDIYIETGRVHLDAGGATELGVTQPGAYAFLRVRDNGAGMDAETQARVFEPFFTTKGVGKGTGLGLATVYGIVRQAGGGIRVQSEPGAGAIFTVVMPAAQGTVEPVEVDRAGVPQRHARGTLLLVEDEPTVRKLVGRVLRRAGFDVVDASNGQEGLDAAARMEIIDAVVTDVVMPVLSGPDMAARLIDERPGLPVLYMSGYADADVLDRVRTGARARLVTKPVPPAELVEILESLLAEVAAPRAGPGSPGAGAGSPGAGAARRDSTTASSNASPPPVSA